MSSEYYEETCQRCNGYGYYAYGETDNPSQVQCEACGGTGVVEVEIEDDREEIDRHH